MTRKCSRRKERREYKPTGAAASCSPQPVGAVPRTPAARSGGPWAAPTVPCARASPTLSSTPLRAGHLSPAARPPALGASSCPSGSGFGFRPERGGGGVTKQREQQGPPVLGLQGGWPGGKACLWLLTSPVHCLWELTLRPEIDLMGGKTSLQGS